MVSSAIGPLVCGGSKTKTGSSLKEMPSPEEMNHAALIIQKNYRGYSVRRVLKRSRKRMHSVPSKSRIVSSSETFSSRLTLVYVDES